jgi:lipopolysaccharide assembly protein B
LVGFWGILHVRKNRELGFSLSSSLVDRLKILFETYSEEVIDSFVQSLDINAETVGVHLSIGSHFRKNGEVEKAMLVHQSLMSRPEALFLQVKDSKPFGKKSLKRLVDICQQERGWLRVREVALAMSWL